VPTFTEEMIARGDHTLVSWQANNAAVWKAIRHLTHGGIAWSWVSQFARTMDGRAAYFAIKTHYLGDSYQSRIKSSAETVLKKSFYDGNARTFTFESYAAALQKAYADLEGAGEPQPETRKVRVLLEGITDPKMKAAVTAVYTSPTLVSNFEAAVNFLSQQHDITQSHQARSRNVSSVSTGDKAKGKKAKAAAKKAKKAGVTDGYVSKKKWWAMTEEQRQAIRDKRTERDARRGVQVVTSTPVTTTASPTATTTTATVPATTTVTWATPITTTQSIGATMSRRNAQN
jgi:hypothetical protein